MLALFGERFAQQFMSQSRLPPPFVQATDANLNYDSMRLSSINLFVLGSGVARPYHHGHGAARHTDRYGGCNQTRYDSIANNLGIYTHQFRVKAGHPG
jgi:hypothetical protein